MGVLLGVRVVGPEFKGRLDFPGEKKRSVERTLVVADGWVTYHDPRTPPNPHPPSQ
jgi:hypothetical protein